MPLDFITQLYGRHCAKYFTCGSAFSYHSLGGPCHLSGIFSQIYLPMFLCSVFIEGIQTLKQHFHVFVEVAPSQFSQWESRVGDWWTGERRSSRLSSSCTSCVSSAVSFLGHFPHWMEIGKEKKKAQQISQIWLHLYIRKETWQTATPSAPHYIKCTPFGAAIVLW